MTDKRAGKVVNAGKHGKERSKPVINKNILKNTNKYIILYDLMANTIQTKINKQISKPVVKWDINLTGYTTEETQQNKTGSKAR